ncbi:MAG TPA: protoporphyrinogen oxidase [Thermoanaerobaculia bacterium]|nr:protoporphyrinogen oxidase [Thermoanaerobaculia bacterium]
MATFCDALVLGAGISGLAAARALARTGFAPVVLEAAPAPGGTLASASQGGFLVELGPNTVQDSPALLALAQDAGCAAGLVAAAGARRRYMVHRGRLTALPSGPPGLLTTPLLSWRAKGRLATEPWRRRGPGPQESVAAFFRRRLGSETLPLADAMGLGVYAGDPDELAIGFAFRLAYALEREHGSLLRGLSRGSGGGRRRPPRLIGFRGGFGALAERLAAGLDLRCGWVAATVGRQGELFAVLARHGEREQTFTARRLVVALPAAATAAVLQPLALASPPALRAIAEVPHAPVAVVALGYERRQVLHPLDGFGFLAPHHEGRRILGCLFSSTLFPERAPTGSVLLTAMAGGRRRPQLAEATDAELVDLVRAELGALLGARGEPALALVRRWQPGIPQPDARWPEVRDAAATLEHAHPGLTLLGNWLHGVGVPDCARAGWEIERTV